MERRYWKQGSKMGDLSTQDFFGVLFGRSGLALKRKETDVPLMREERKRPARTEERTLQGRGSCAWLEGRV